MRKLFWALILVAGFAGAAGYEGDFAEDDTVSIVFSTHATDGSAVAPSSALDTADFVIYKNNSDTQKTSANGLTITNVDAVTGRYRLDVDTSNDTGDGGFWVVASDYNVWISSAKTLDSIAIHSSIGSFSIENRYERGTDSALLAADKPTNFEDLAIANTTGYTSANLVQILADAQSATDAKVLFDDWFDPAAIKGLAIATVDVTTNLTNSATGAAGLTDIADSFTLTTGTTEAGDVTSTYNVDGVYHQVSDDTGEIEVYYEFDIGPQGQPSGGSWTGRLQEGPPAATTIEVYAYNWGDTAWDEVDSITGVTAATDSPLEFTLFSQYVGTSANVGLIRIRFYNAALDSGATDLYTDQIFISYTKDQIDAGYQDASIWIDTNGANSGAVRGFDGTAFNPVNNLADAFTLSGLTGLKSFRIQQGSTITLDRTYLNYTFTGIDYIMDFSDELLDASVVEGAVVSGVATGDGGSLLLISCSIGEATLPDGAFIDCAFGGPITLGDAGDYTFNDCFSVIPGTAAPVFDFGAATGTQRVNIRDYAGGLDMRNFGASGTDTASFDCPVGQLILNANCEDGGSMRRSGMHRLQDNSGDTGTAVTITDGYGMTILTDSGEFVSGITGAKNTFDDLNDISTANVATELETYDGPTNTEMLAAHATTDADIAALPTAVENRQEMDSNSTQLAAIVADTNELQTDDVPGLIASAHSTSDALLTARSRLDADYFSWLSDTVTNVGTTANLTTNNDKTDYTLSLTGIKELFTVDANETEVTGSVVKEAQGAAGGNVTVEAFTVPALAQFGDTDTGLTTVVEGSVIDLAQTTEDGDTLVNQNTGGTNNLQVKDTAGDPVGGAYMRCYRKVDYDADNFTNVRATDTTDDNGAWSVYLTTGITYTITADYEGRTDLMEVTP